MEDFTDEDEVRALLNSVRFRLAVGLPLVTLEVAEPPEPGEQGSEIYN